MLQHVATCFNETSPTERIEIIREYQTSLPNTCFNEASQKERIETMIQAERKKCFMYFHEAS